MAQPRRRDKSQACALIQACSLTNVTVCVDDAAAAWKNVRREYPDTKYPDALGACHATGARICGARAWRSFRAGEYTGSSAMLLRLQPLCAGPMRRIPVLHAGRARLVRASSELWRHRLWT